MTATAPVPVDEPQRAISVVALASATAAVAGIVGCLVVAVIARAAGVSHGFPPLQPGSYISLVILASIAGAIGWRIVCVRSANPRQLLSRLVPIVVAVSFVPDVLVGATKSTTDTTWGGVLALMVMHLVVAAVAVRSYSWFLPPRRTGAATV